MGKMFCAGPRASEILTEDKLAKWKESGKSPAARVGCGQDLTEQIEKLPRDGEPHEYRCPVCGNHGTAFSIPEATPTAAATTKPAGK